MTTMISIGISMGIAVQKRFLMKGLRKDLKKTRITTVERPMMKLLHVNSVMRENTSRIEEDEKMFGHSHN